MVWILLVFSRIKGARRSHFFFAHITYALLLMPHLVQSLTLHPLVPRPFTYINTLNVRTDAVLEREVQRATHGAGWWNRLLL